MMNSTSPVFSSKSLITNLKRRPRTRTKTSKPKTLDTLPELAEEEESRASTSSVSSYDPPYCASRSAGGNVTLGGRASCYENEERSRESRRIVLTGAGDLTFDDFFPLSSAPPRPAPKPPVSSTPSMESPLDEINLRFSGLGISLDFPSPPPRQSTSSSRREPSPTPSEASSRTSSGSSAASHTMPLTPVTSDDESMPQARLARSPTCKSQRASIMFMKSMPDLKRPPLPRKAFAAQESEEEWSDGEDAAWLAENLGEVVTLTTPLPPSPTATTSRTRPDSIPPPPRNKALPVVPLSVKTTRGPSTQLDPTFHESKRVSRYIPTRPPPPPPIIVETCPSPTMEEKTEELLALLANAALDTEGFFAPEQFATTPVTPSSTFIVDTPTGARPPPRMSIPADINDFFEDEAVMSRLPLSPSSWITRFHLGGSGSGSQTSSPSKPKHQKSSKSLRTPKSSTSSTSSSSSSSSTSYPSKVPLSPAAKRSLDLERRDSRSSRMSSDTSSDSGESTSSNGLRRKPIPVEIFMR
ncbi:hypothetical protein K474DRAFT_235463 [Panus rudis PR-1116 ss-1]|nr:hypothetical protein K474DRAFT_235463 [Panus rudis PR-1116 ss-1]